MVVSSKHIFFKPNVQQTRTRHNIMVTSLALGDHFHTHSPTHTHTHTHAQTWYTRMYLLYMIRPVRLLRVSISEGLLKQTLNSKGWEFSCPLKCIGSLPESLTQGLLVGKLLVGGLGAWLLALRCTMARETPHSPAPVNKAKQHISSLI